MNMELSDFHPIGPIVIVFILSIAYIFFYERSREKNTPYSYFGHPHRCVLDKLIGLLFPYISPIHKVANYICKISEDSDESASMLEFMSKLREKLEHNVAIHHKMECKRIDKYIKTKDESNFLVVGKVLVQRNSNILSNWKIADVRDKDEGLVEVSIFCPRSVIKGQCNIEEEDDDDMNGFKVLTTCKLEDLSISNVDIFINFHGGGFVLLNSQDAFGSKFGSLLKIRMEETSECPQFVMLSVDYRLAPEHPFPAPVIDGLSVADFVFGAYPNSQVHFTGTSAGGNLSAVVGLESVRQFPGRVKSIISVDPMLLPQANTNSYHMNSRHSPFCPVEFLRWSWAAYLEFNPDEIEKLFTLSPHSYEKALMSCKLFQHKEEGSDENKQNLSLLRLITPQINLPPNLCDEKSLTVIVTTSKGDPLHDDGCDLVQKLINSSANVHHFDVKGSHVVSELFDKKNSEMVHKCWNDSIW